MKKEKQTELITNNKPEEGRHCRSSPYHTWSFHKVHAETRASGPSIMSSKNEVHLIKLLASQKGPIENLNRLHRHNLSKLGKQ